MHPTIRLATSADVPLLVDLMHEFYAESHVPLDRHEAGATFAHLLGDRARGAVWLLAAGHAPAGYVVLTVGFSMEYGGLDAFVDDLFVRPAFRRKGFGRAALATLLAECERRGVRAVHLEVGRDNHPANALYARFGFRDNDRQLLTVRLPREPEGGKRTMGEMERARRKVVLTLECPGCHSHDVVRERPAGPSASGSGKVLNVLRYHCTCRDCATHFLYQRSPG